MTWFGFGALTSIIDQITMLSTCHRRRADPRAAEGIVRGLGLPLPRLGISEAEDLPPRSQAPQAPEFPYRSEATAAWASSAAMSASNSQDG
jgi:hypothetical protein